MTYTQEQIAAHIKKLKSQIGDDVQQIYDYEALFKISADMLKQLAVDRDNAVAEAHACGAERERWKARAETAEINRDHLSDKLALEGALTDGAHCRARTIEVENALLKHALVVWDAAYRTGRNEPLVVAFETGVNALQDTTP